MAELGAVLGGRYRLDQVLGQGGMATIFRATDAQLGREVAVKLLRPEYGRDPEFVARFSEEARAAASLNHPNIVAVYDFGTDPAGPFIVMEQVAGGDLSLALGEHGVLPPTAVARTGQQVADALAAAHARGLVHRDIKPGNILLSPDGRVQVADFGIAQAASSAPLTAEGLTLGSVLYFSPEQARGDWATAASDVYSLGLVMYEVLTGRRAFAGDSPAAVAVARLSGGVPSPMAVRPDTPPPLDAIVRWCLDPDPAARPSAADLSSALARFIADPSGAAYGTAMPPGGAAVATEGTLGPGARPPRQRAPSADSDRAGSGPWAWLAAVLGLVVIVASGILLFLLFSGIGDATPSPSPQPTTTPELVRMPDFVGRTEGWATRTADRLDLTLEIEYVEADARPGRVVAQLPNPRMEIPAGTSVTLRVATRAETVVVPDVHGLSEASAMRELEAVGLRPGDRSRVDDALPKGYVVSTDPRGGDEVTRDSVVDYVVSSGRAPIPGVSHAPTDGGDIGPASLPSAGPELLAVDATAASASPSASDVSVDGSPVPSPLAGTSPTAAPSSAPSADGGPQTSAPVSGPSISPGSSPPASTSLAPGAGAPTSSSATPGDAGPVSSEVATAVPAESAGLGQVESAPPQPSQELVLVGDFRCLDLATARGHIEEKGLLVGAIIPSDPAPGDDWLVQQQLPDSGEYLPAGSNVDLVLADPMEPCPDG